MEKIKFVNTDGLAYNNAMNKMLDRERRKSFSSFINNEYCWGIGFDILRRFKYTNPDLRPYSEIDEILGIKVIRILYHADDTSKICLTNYVNDCMPIMIASRGSGKTYTQFKYLDEMMKKWNRGVVNNNQSIKNVIFNDPATIMFWTDGTKTVVKAENEPFDPEKGLAMAIIKKLFGTNESKSNYNDIFKKWLPEEKDCSSNPFGNEIFCEDCEHYHSNASTHLCSKCANSATSYYTPRKK